MVIAFRLWIWGLPQGSTQLCNTYLIKKLMLGLRLQGCSQNLEVKKLFLFFRARGLPVFSSFFPEGLRGRKHCRYLRSWRGLFFSRKMARVSRERLQQAQG